MFVTANQYASATDAVLDAYNRKQMEKAQMFAQMMNLWIKRNRRSEIVARTVEVDNQGRIEYVAFAPDERI